MRRERSIENGRDRGCHGEREKGSLAKGLMETGFGCSSRFEKICCTGDRLRFAGTDRSGLEGLGGVDFEVVEVSRS